MGERRRHRAVHAGAVVLERSVRQQDPARRCADGTIVVNDAYNANPDSMRAALEALAAIGGRESRRVAVLGEMRELGEESEEGHRSVGRAAAQLGIDTLVLVGPSAAQIAEGVNGGPGSGDVEVVLTDSRDDASAWVRDNVAPGAAVLVKASRGAALEVLAQQVIDDREGTIR